jgi:ADP-ribose pyrophosphatase YjhB (NUDIX family)
MGEQMNENELEKIIEIILNRIKDKSILWRIEGSANLKMQGIDVSIRDLDIATNSQGIESFRNSLKDYIVKDFFSEKTKGQSIVCDIEGFEVEINCYGDRTKNYFDKIKIIEWKKFEVPILPLQYALDFYKSINREEKVEIVRDYLSKREKSHFEIEHEGDIYDTDWFNTNKLPNLEGTVHVHAFVFNEEGKILLVYFPNKNIWQLPGGKMESGEDAENCLKREIDEEADIDIKEIKFYGYLKAKARISQKAQMGLRYIAKVDNIKEQTTDPCEGVIPQRKFIDPKDFEEYVQWGENGQIQLRKALKIYNNNIDH